MDGSSASDGATAQAPAPASASPPPAPAATPQDQPSTGEAATPQSAAAVAAPAAASANAAAPVAPPPVPAPVSGAAVVRVDVDSPVDGDDRETADAGVTETKHAETTKPRGASLVAAQKLSHRQRPPPGRFTLQYGFSTFHKLPVYVLLVGVLTFLFSGVCMIGVASWGVSYPGAIGRAAPTAGLELLLATGFCLVVAATVGGYGALNRSRMQLRWFAAIGFLVIAMQIVAGVVTITWVGDNDSAYIDKLNAGADPSTYSSFETRVDDALTNVMTSCCDAPTGVWPDLPDCIVLNAFNVPKAECSDAVAFKTTVVTAVMDELVRPLAIAGLALLAPQLVCIIVVCWLLVKLDPTDKHIADDIDHAYQPFPCDADGIPLTPEADDYPYVFAIVFPAPDEHPAKKSAKKAKYSMETLLRAIRKAGLATRLEWTSTQEEIICRITATRSRLEIEADRINYKLRLDSKALELADRKTNQVVRGKDEILQDLDKKNRWAPYDYLYAKFDLMHELIEPGKEPEGEPNNNPGAQKRTLYRRDRATNSKFREIDIVKLVFSILQGDPTATPPGAGLALGDLHHKGYIKEFFPLHNNELLHVLRKDWVQWFNGVWDQPLRRIRSYFGEKVGLYIAFSAHYTKWLFAPALIGAGVFAHQRGARDFSVNTLAIFAIFVSVWATCMLEFWKRKTHFFAKEWGMTEYEVLEVKRPQYVNNPLVTKVPSPITGLHEEYFDPKIKRRRIMFSWVTISTLVGIVLTAVFSIFVLRLWLVSLERNGTIPVGAAGNIAAAVNAVQIQILNLVYGKVARKLNDMENHATQTQYEDNLIAKTFCFQFVNSYFNLFYVGFIKNYMTLFGETQQCTVNVHGDPDCIAELSSQLSIIFLTRLVVGNTTEALVPWAKFWWKQRREAKLAKAEHRENIAKSPAEVQFDLEDYTAFDDYAEHVIQFGYVSLFVVAFPLAPLLAFMNNYVELRVDAFKLVHNCCRPDPEGAQDIGTWFRWMQLMANIAVVSNLALICFVQTGEAFTIPWMNEHPVWSFIILEHIVFTIKYFFDAIIPDTPRSVNVQMARQEYLVDKLFFGIQDDLIDESQVHALIVEQEEDAAAAGVASPGAMSPNADGGPFNDPVEYDANAGVGWSGIRRRHA